MLSSRAVRCQQTVLPLARRAGLEVTPDPALYEGASLQALRLVETLARAAVAVGVAGVFIETHEDPDNAPSDGPNMVPLKDLPALLERLMAFDRVAKAV